MIQRHPKWQSRLAKFLYEHEHCTFRYGTLDCCLFVADAIQAMTDVDIADVYRGKYSSRDTAMALVKEIDGKASVQACAYGRALAYGMKEVPVNFAQRGDMILVTRARDYSLGIVAPTGRHIIIALRVGYGLVDISRGCRAWRV